jgi:hypothetical protein
MRRKSAIFGAVLMVVAFGILTIFIIAPAMIMPLDYAPLLKDIIQRAVCGSDETLSAAYSTYSTPGTTSTSIDYTCVDKQENAREVGDDIIKAAGIGYVVIFLTGLFTFMFGMQDTGKQTKSSSASVKSGKSSNRSESIASETLDFQPKDSPEHVPLAQRLQELKDALHQGLITEAEYKAKRQQLLDES